MPEPLLRTEALSRSFGSLRAVDRVDLTMHAGELRSIIGPNGAGKTTFFRLISGEMAPSTGRVWFKGRDITGLPQHTVARLGISKSYQITNVFPHLTVHENVRVAVQGWARSFNFWSRADRLTDVAERAHEILRTVGLTPRAALLAAHLSHGEKRHLEIGIAKSYQITNVFPHLSVLENVRVAVQGYHHAFNFWSRAAALEDVKARARELLGTVGLSAKAELLAAELSHGEKRHLEIAIALAGDPTLLLLDEPTAGMSPEETDATMIFIRRLAEGRTIVLVEHKMKVVMRISDRITVLHQGEVLAEGTPEEIRANERVQQTYLGVVR